jgi:hypothetical protein
MVIEGSLIRMIAEAGEADLQQVVARIAEIKADITKFVAARKAELASLQMVQKILFRKLHPNQKAERKPRDHNAPPKKSGSMELANQLYDLITKEGSMPSAVAAKKLGKSAAQIGGVAWRSTWFHTENGEISIAKAR